MNQTRGLWKDQALKTSSVVAILLWPCGEKSLCLFHGSNIVDAIVGENCFSSCGNISSSLSIQLLLSIATLFKAQVICDVVAGWT
jgi:hypothetical protein